MYIYKTGDTVGNCSPPLTKQCSVSLQAAAAPLANSSQVYSLFAWCHMVLKIPLGRWGQLSSCCLLPAPCTSSSIAARTVWEAEKLKCPLLCTALLSNNYNIDVLSTSFSSSSQNKVSYQMLWRKNQLCPTWNLDRNDEYISYVYKHRLKKLIILQSQKSLFFTLLSKRER